MVKDINAVKKELDEKTEEVNRLAACVCANMSQSLALLDKCNILDKSKVGEYGHLTQNRENKELRDRLALLRKESIKLEKLIQEKAQLYCEYYIMTKYGA